MRRTWTRIIGGLSIAVAAIVAQAGVASAADVTTVSDILASPEEYAGMIVTVEGELIGDYGFRREGMMWTQLNDDSYARDAVVDGGPLTGANIGIGITMPDELAENLDPPGGYRLEGPLVAVTGTWVYHDPDRGGESYLDVDALTVVDPGRRLEEGPDWLALGIGVVLLFVTAAMRASVVARRRRLQT